MWLTVYREEVHDEHWNKKQQKINEFRFACLEAVLGDAYKLANWKYEKTKFKCLKVTSLPQQSNSNRIKQKNITFGDTKTKKKLEKKNFKALNADDQVNC